MKADCLRRILKGSRWDLDLCLIALRRAPLLYNIWDNEEQNQGQLKESAPLHKVL